MHGRSSAPHLEDRNDDDQTLTRGTRRGLAPWKGVGRDRDRAFGELTDVCHEQGLPFLAGEFFKGAQGVLESSANAHPDEGIGNEVLGEEVVDVDHEDFGGRGMKALVVR